jgi:hypothetical protein
MFDVKYPKPKDNALQEAATTVALTTAATQIPETKTSVQKRSGKRKSSGAAGNKGSARHYIYREAGYCLSCGYG